MPMPSSTSRNGAESGDYPDSSRTDWGRSNAIGDTSTTGRNYCWDGCSCLDLEAYQVRSDGGLKSAEELPPGRYAVWE